jgi:hypothetical protein
VVSRHDLEDTAATVGLEVEPSHQILAGENRQAVVAVDSLRRRFEDLENLMKAEQLLDPVSIPKEGVEG